MNEATEIRKGEELDKTKLTTFIKNEMQLNVDSLHISQFAGGYSNLTYLLEINETIQWVLRKPPVGANIKSGHDMSREYHVLKALFPSYNKVPKPILFCNDLDILGSDFYIMEKVEGWILRSGTATDFLPAPDNMKHIFNVFTDNFVVLHQLDIHDIGLSSLAVEPENYPERQIFGWTKRYFNSKTEDVASVENLAHWLASHIPKTSGISLIHNDYKYDNLVLDPLSNDINAVLDWEMSTIGDPLMDVGSSLGYWVNADDPDWLKDINISPTTLPGNPSREELLQGYALRSGKDPGNGVFYFAYGMFKLAVIAQQIYARYTGGHTRNPKFANLHKVVDACGTMGMQAVVKKRLDTLF
jgi:aminoglycoside phosphotransferase (APT) family kinase protein